MITLKPYLAGALLLLTLSLSTSAQEANESVETLDLFYKASSQKSFNAARYFLPTAQCHSINYDEAGNSKVTTMSAAAFQKQVDTLLNFFQVRHEPMVIISRYYGNLASAYMSVFTSLVDRETKDTIYLRSMQTVHLVFDRTWMISNLAIQNEVPGYPFNEDFWPKSITNDIKLGATQTLVTAEANSVFTPYDPSKIYNADEVEIAPEYPGNKAVYNGLLEAFKVTTKSDLQGTPFTVVIAEDGLASLSYTGDLSATEIERATSFVNSMMVWFPAVKDAASVKCKLIFYLL